MVRYFLIFLFCSCMMPLKAKEFLYPVAAIEGKKEPLLLLIYQKSFHELELFVWDSETKLKSKMLASSWTPAALALLPSSKGFGFIDNGRIRIKQFQKRSPKSLELDEPLFSFGGIYWIDDSTFYTSACKGKNYGIFQINIWGEVTKIAWGKEFDALYPQRIDDNYFYIERNKNYTSSVVSIKTPVVSLCDMKKNFKTMEALINSDDSLSSGHIDQEKEVLFQSVIPIIFLKMISRQEGYFIEHSESTELNSDYLLFEYHQIKKTEGFWRHMILFSFLLPKDLFMAPNESRLYESLLPLLPRHFGEDIYYSSCADMERDTVDLFSYSLREKKTLQLTNAHSGQRFFAPIKIKDEVFYGGTLESIKSFRKA